MFMCQSVCLPLGQILRAWMPGSLGKPTHKKLSYFPQKKIIFFTNLPIQLVVSGKLFQLEKSNCAFNNIGNFSKYFVEKKHFLMANTHRWGTTTHNGVQAEILQGLFTFLFTACFDCTSAFVGFQTECIILSQMLRW